MTEDSQPLFRTFDFDRVEDVRQWSRAAGASLNGRLQATRQLLAARGVDSGQMRFRVNAFAEKLQRVAPHWLAEAAEIAAGIQTSADDILMLNCLPSFSISRGGGCTSFIQIGRTHNRLLKIRDELNRDQYAMIRRVRGRWFQAAADIGNLGYAHVFRADGLAGGNNTGSPAEGIEDRVGLNDCHVLRYIVENARSVDDIPSCFESLLEADALCGVGGPRGGILLFCDSKRGLIIEYTPTRYVAQFVDAGRVVRANHFLTPQALGWGIARPNLNTRRRHERMCELLGNDRWHEPKELFAIVRDRKHHPHALCNDDVRRPWMTVSVQIHDIDRNQPDQSVNYICCGHPRFSPFIPATLRQRETFVPLADGEYYRRSDQNYRQRCGSREHLGRLRQLESSGPAHLDYRAFCMAAWGAAGGNG